MLTKDEKNIVSIIKYSTPFIIIITSFIIIIFLYLENRTTLEKEKLFVKTQFIKKNKELIKNDVDKLYDFINKTQNETETNLKNYIKNRVLEAHSIAMNIYNENKDTKSKDEITKMIKDALVNIKFNNNRGYYFIYSFDYECVLFPLKRELEGTNFYDFQDSKGTYLTREIINSLKDKDEAFLNWWFYKPEDVKSTYEKIGFNKYFKPYDWFIGTGEYIVDFESNIQKEILNYMKKLNNEDNNHYFIINFNKEILFHLKDSYINKNSEEVDFFSDKENVINDIINIAKRNAGFISYTPKNGTSTKTLYVKGDDKYGWAIGKVFYEKDLNKILEEKEKELNASFEANLKNILIITLIVTLLLLIFSIYITKLIEIKFLNYKKDIKKYIEEREKQHHILSQQSKMAAMGEMLGSIAHQWRQPLSVISTISSGIRIQNEMNDLDKEDLDKSLNNITQTAQYLSKTIDDFRNFYKPNKREDFFNIKDALEKTEKIVQAQLKNNNIILIRNIEDFQLFGLENEFIQSLINIMNNSKDALEIKEDDRFIFIDTFEDDNFSYVVVKDNAGGIEEDKLSRICEPYFTTKDDTKGTGIGLYMCNEIITKHMKGSMEITNTTYNFRNEDFKGLQTKIKFKKSPTA